MKQIFSLLIGIVFAFGCVRSSTNDQTQKIIDDTGLEIQVPVNPQRMMGLSAALTEYLFYLLPADKIIGVTHVCNYPPQAIKTKPVVNTWPFDYEKCLALKPDLLFTDEGITSTETIHRLGQQGIPVYTFRFEKLEDIGRAMSQIARIAKIDDTTKIKNWNDSLSLLRTQSTENQKVSKPKCLIITWANPIVVYGHNTLATDMLRLAGGENALDSNLARPYPEITREMVLKMNPDVIFGGSFSKMDSTFFSQYPELKTINAYRNKAIYDLTDDLISRPTPRALQAVVEIRKNLLQQIK